MDAVELVTKFYSSFQRRDADAMCSCYAPKVAFSDPVFVGLEDDRARGMWRMLCKQAGPDLRVEFRDVTGDATRASAHWEAWYTFSATKKKVHNVIEARFELKDGLIVKHTDTFDLPRWMGQALGVPGKLFGWSGFLQSTLRKKAAQGLDAFLARQ